MEWNWERFTCWFQLDWIIFTFISPKIKIIIMENKNEKQKRNWNFFFDGRIERILDAKFSLRMFYLEHLMHFILSYNEIEMNGLVNIFFWFVFQIFNFDFTLFLCEKSYRSWGWIFFRLSSLYSLYLIFHFIILYFLLWIKEYLNFDGNRKFHRRFNESFKFQMMEIGPEVQA